MCSSDLTRAGAGRPAGRSSRSTRAAVAAPRSRGRSRRTASTRRSIPPASHTSRHARARNGSGARSGASRDPRRRPARGVRGDRRAPGDPRARRARMVQRWAARVSDLRTSDARRRRMRAYLLARDGRGCGRCGDPIDESETPSLGHITARVHGGSDAAANLRLEHLDCNRNAGAERDRARVVNANPRSLEGDRLRVFSTGGDSSALPRRPWNGARIRPNYRTSVRFRLIAPEAPGSTESGSSRGGE